MSLVKNLDQTIMILLLGFAHMPQHFNSDIAPVKHTVCNAYFYFQSARTHEIHWYAKVPLKQVELPEV